MSFQGLKNKTMSILREGSKTKNGIGELVGTWAAVATGVGIRFQQTAAEERSDEVRAVVRKGKIWFDLGLDLTESDRVEIDGSQWELVALDPDVAGSGHHGAAEIRAVD